MTELSIRPDEIRDAISRHVAEYQPDTSREEIGQVAEAGDGIARVEGLPSTMANELLEFTGGVKGLALNLDVPIEEAMATLDAHGVRYRGPIDRGYERSIYFRDPNGAVIELLETLIRGAGSTMIMATHSTTLASTCDRTFELHNGKLVES